MLRPYFFGFPFVIPLLCARFELMPFVHTQRFDG
jgi:hypothetical protein